MAANRKFIGRAAFALMLGTALVSCKPAATTPAASVAAQPWAQFTQTTIDSWLAIDPAWAVYQGAHQFDGKLPDWSEAGLTAKADFLQGVIDHAKAYDQLTGDEKFERDNMVKVAEGQLFWLKEADQPHTNPAFYIGTLDPNTYIAREYADKPTRMKALIGYMTAIPAAAAQIRANLKTAMPASFIKYGTAGFGGFADAYVSDARAAFADVKDPALQKQLADSSQAASKSMADLRDWLKGQEASATQDFALGPDRFAHMLSATEAVDTPIAELEKIGLADLKRNQDALKAECATFAPGKTIQLCMDKLNANKPVGGPVAEATRQIPMLTAFVKANDIVTIPGTEKALVHESPPYNRQNGAYIDPPGPFEKGLPSIYYISPPDPSWSKAKQDAYIPGVDDLMFTSVHEVMPGHFLQLLHANRSPSLFGRLFVGYAYAEGWAHYSEEMMWEAGLGNGDPQIHIGQLSNALLRDCRFLSAIGMHSKGMTMAQSKQMFIEQCFQDEGTADQQAARGTYDPAYLNYTMGKLMIRKLRADWTASHGGREGWKAFHDAFLNYGGPPIPLVRQAMMNESKPTATF